MARIKSSVTRSAIGLDHPQFVSEFLIQLLKSHHGSVILPFVDTPRERNALRRRLRSAMEHADGEIGDWMEFRLSHEEALKKLNERYPPDADAPTIQDGALTIAEAVDTLLLSANEPMSRSELMDGLAAAWERGQLRNEPNDNSLRAILSRDADKRGWIKVGQGQNVNYKHRDQPKEIDPSDFGIDSGQASSNSGDIP